VFCLVGILVLRRPSVVVSPPCHSWVRRFFLGCCLTSFGVFTISYFVVVVFLLLCLLFFFACWSISCDLSCWFYDIFFFVLCVFSTSLLYIIYLPFKKKETRHRLNMFVVPIKLKTFIFSPYLILIVFLVLTKKLHVILVLVHAKTKIV
jgi:hypothetical protein